MEHLGIDRAQTFDGLGETPLIGIVGELRAARIARDEGDRRARRLHFLAATPSMGDLERLELILVLEIEIDDRHDRE